MSTGPGGGADPATGHRQNSQAASPSRFTEMPTDNFIESSFWNFDALFQPQQHPARDQHDTFFLRGGWNWPRHQRCQAWAELFGEAYSFYGINSILGVADWAGVNRSS